MPGCWFSLGVLENANADQVVPGPLRPAGDQPGVAHEENAFGYLDTRPAVSARRQRDHLSSFLNGERSPIWDPYARGVLFGLSGSHKRADVIRAILEGVALAFAHNLELFETALGVNMNEVSLSGGGAKSRVWQQIHADVSGKRMNVVQVKESEAIGNAILAGYGVGIYPDMVKAAKQVVKIERVVEPRTEFAQRYADLFGLYKKLYLHLKEDFAELAKIQ